MSTNIAPGTFIPAPQRASAWSMAKSQGRIEAKLMLRHGEQFVLNMLIPLALLIAGDKMPFSGDVQLDDLVPMVLAIAATGSGFSGQAIAVAFDRRYGALKRAGASGAPSWTIIAGKVLGVLTVVVVQIAIIAIAALLLGWHPSPLGLVVGIVPLIMGVAAFTSLGLLLGGTQSPEFVLASANLLWIVMLGIVSWVFYSLGLDNAGWWNLVPSVSLASGLDLSYRGAFPWLQSLILAGWTIVAAGAASRKFKFE